MNDETGSNAAPDTAPARPRESEARWPVQWTDRLQRLMIVALTKDGNLPGLFGYDPCPLNKRFFNILCVGKGYFNQLGPGQDGLKDKRLIFGYQNK